MFRYDLFDLVIIVACFVWQSSKNQQLELCFYVLSLTATPLRLRLASTTAQFKRRMCHSLLKDGQ